MQNSPPNGNSKSATPAAEAVVFVTEGPIAVWTGHDWSDLQDFIDDMKALGFPVWRTPRLVFVFTGAAD